MKGSQLRLAKKCCIMEEDEGRLHLFDMSISPVLNSLLYTTRELYVWGGIEGQERIRVMKTFAENFIRVDVCKCAGV